MLLASRHLVRKGVMGAWAFARLILSLSLSLGIDQTVVPRSTR
jgi:hypothetical protein